MLEEDQSIMISGWFARGWETYKKNTWPLIGGAIIIQLFGLIFSLTDYVVEWRFVSWVVYIILGPVMGVGWLYLSLCAVRNEDVHALKVFDAFSRFGTAWGTSIIAILAICIGAVLLIVPGIIVALMFFAAPFAVMDKGMGVIRSLKYSKNITSGFKGRLFGMYCLAALLSLIGVPFTFGMQYNAPVYIVYGAIPYLIMVFVITPWLGATYAAAYNGLIKYSEIGSDNLPESSNQLTSE